MTAQPADRNGQEISPSWRTPYNAAATMRNVTNNPPSITARDRAVTHEARGVQEITTSNRSITERASDEAWLTAIATAKARLGATRARLRTR